MVFGKDNPFTSSCLGEPIFILGIRWEIVVVNVNDGPYLAESGCDSFLP
jgi:hypothetical protein